MTSMKTYALDALTAKCAHFTISGHFQFSTFKLCYLFRFSRIHHLKTGQYRDKRSKIVHLQFMNSQFTEALLHTHK